MVCLRPLSVFLLLHLYLPNGRCQCPDSFRWEKTKKLLFCPNKCNDHIFDMEKDRCCSCNALPEWLCNSNFAVGELYLEYTKRKGKGRIVNPDDKSYNVYKISQVSGYMSEFPGNICDFPRIVEIDFRWNNIRTFRNISCLVNLDTIILKGNLITIVRNSTFVGLRHLRKVDLSQNRLNFFELGTISGASSGINYVFLNDNFLSVVDVIDIIVETPFCRMDLSNNQITEISNENAWVVDNNITYGSGGRVDLTGNSFTEFFDFEYLGFKDLRFLGKLLGFTFDIRDAQFPCDCKMEPFLVLSKEIIERVYRDFFELRCSSPEHMKDELILNFVRNKSLDMFVCDITRHCSPGCTCFEQPSRNRVVVNCSSQNLPRMPRHLPRLQNLEVDLSGNNIQKIEDVHYLPNISKIDFSYNDVSTIPSFFVNSIRNALSISFVRNDKIRKLPRNIQTLDPCVFRFGGATLDCACNTIWVKEWLSVKGNGTCNTFIMCDIDKKQKLNVMQISEDILECPNAIPISTIVAISMTVVSFVIGVIAFFTNLYRFEIYLMWRNVRQKHHCKNATDIVRYDAFVSLNEEDSELLSWVTHRFLPSLERRGYRLFLPCRDLDLGSVREESVTQNIVQSKNFIIFLSSDYFNLEQPWTQIEWRMAWNLYTRFMDRRILVINYGQVRACAVDNSAARAFLRLRLFIDFTNRKHELMTVVRNNLGNPSIGNLGYNSKNSKPLFHPYRIWPDVQFGQK